jgi:hypothetical protein
MRHQSETHTPSIDFGMPLDRAQFLVSKAQSLFCLLTVEIWSLPIALLIYLLSCTAQALPRPDWSRPLPRPLTIPDILTLETLEDVRVLVEKHLPAEYRSKFTWRHFAGLLKRAAEGQQDVAEVSTALRIVLQREGIRCQ